MTSARLAVAILCAVAIAFIASSTALAAGPSPFYVPTPGSAFFSPSSVWNQELAPDAPRDPSSSSLVSMLSKTVNTQQAGKYGPWITTSGYSTPIYTVPADQPTTHVTLENVNPYLQSAFAAVPLPPEAQPATLSDGQLVVWQPSTNTMWEFWKLHQTLSGWSAKWGGVMDGVTDAPGMFTPASYQGSRNYWGATGSGLPLLGGLITIQDLQQGHIDHALAIGIPETKYKLWSWPATRTDGARVSGIPEGTRFRLSPSLNLAALKLPPVALMIAQAAQRYGIVVRDSSPTVQFYAEEPTIAGASPYPQLFGGQFPWQLLGKFPWTSLEVLRQQIDTEPPWAKIVAEPAKASNEASPTFAFTSAKPGSVFECEIDSAPAPTHCDSGSFTAHNLASGWHLFTVKAISASGLQQSSATPYWWLVDTTPPVTTLTSAPASTTNRTSAYFAFSAKDITASTFQCQLDGGEWSSCRSEEAAYSDLGPGSHTFSVSATDAVGNQELTPVSYTWTVDTTPPTTTVLSQPPSIAGSSSASFKVASSKPGSIIECRLDDGAWSTCVSSAQCAILQGEIAGCSFDVQFAGLSDGGHTLEARAVDEAVNTDPGSASYSWTVDTDPPLTTISQAPPSYTDASSAILAFAAVDTTAASFQCSLDDGPWFTCSSPLSFSGLDGGSHSVKVRATDAAGNLEAAPPPSASWTVDTDPPQTTIGQAPPALSDSDSVQFAFSATDAAPVSFECRLDGGEFSPCTSPSSFSNLAEGAHTFQVRASDAAGNTEVPPSPESKWTVDTTPPATTISGAPSSITGLTWASFTLSSSKPGSSFRCELDQEGFSPCGSPVSYSSLAPGPHTFKAKATDPAGATEISPAPTAAWTIDTTPPFTTISSAPASTTNTTSAFFTLSSSKPGSSFRCALDGTGYSPCSSPLAYAALSPGSHTFQAQATDEAGNSDPSPPSYTWTIDTTPPVTTITSGPSIGISRTDSVTFQFSSSEPESTFRCQLDASGWTSCSSPASYAGLSSGNHTFSVQAMDAAGNSDLSPQSQAFLVSPPAAFSPASFLNAPLDPSAPIAGQSDELVADLQSQVDAEIAAHTGPTIVTSNSTTDVYWASSSVPTVKVGGLPKSAPPSLVQALSAVPIPSNARPTAGLASQITIIQTSTDSLWELKGVWRTNGSWYAAWGGAMQSLSTNPGYFTPASWGATGSAIPLIGGMITPGELQSGRIEHALALQLPSTGATQFSWPAQRSDGLFGEGGAIPVGTRFRLDRTLDVASLKLPPLVRALAEAAQRYGIVVRGRALRVSFYAEEPTAASPYPSIFGATPLWAQLSLFPWGDLQALPLVLSH